MTTSLQKRILLGVLLTAACSAPAFGHLSYSGRDFGTFSGLTLQTRTNSSQTALGWSWADGTDEDFMHTHRIKFFKFTLESTATVTISIQSLAPELFLPGFSLYSGLAHTSPLDYENTITLQYLTTLPGPAKEGAFNALGTWRMGNDASQSYSDFSTFTYIGHAADGTSANYGNAVGINGDGVADGFVTSSFVLPAGSYTLAVGGATYAGQGSQGAVTEGGYADAILTEYGMNVGVSVVPEPSTGILAAGGMLLMGMIRRRRKLVRRCNWPSEYSL